MDHYIFVSSSDSNHYFSDNTTSSFKVRLNRSIDLTGHWKVALIEFRAITNRKKGLEEIDIYSDLCKETFVSGEERPVLRRLMTNTNEGWDYTLVNPFYLPVKKTDLREFKIYIRNSNNDESPKLAEPVHLTLHLQRYPFL